MGYDSKLPSRGVSWSWPNVCWLKSIYPRGVGYITLPKKCMTWDKYSQCPLDWALGILILCFAFFWALGLCQIFAFLLMGTVSMNICKKCVTCLRPCPLNSWQNSTPFWPLAHLCSSSGSRVSNFAKFRTCVDKWRIVSTRDRHVKDTCHLSGTMSIESVVKFYLNLTPGTPR